GQASPTRGPHPMLDPFWAIAHAAREVVGAAQAILISTYLSDRPSLEQAARARLRDLDDAAERCLALRLPPTRDGYHEGGRQGWEFDLRRTLQNLQTDAREYLDAALRLPLPPGREDWFCGSEPLTAFGQAQAQAHQECQQVQQRIDAALQRIWSLGCWVDDSPPRHAEPPGAPAPPPPVHPDGPAGGHLWWKGKPHDIPKGVIYRLISFMWSRSHAHYDDLVEQVFEGETESENIRSRASEV